VALAERLHGRQLRTYFDLEHTAELGPRIGFEFFSEPPPTIDPLRRAPTAVARELGLLSTAQIEALERWTGRFSVALGGESWPSRVYRWFDLKFTSAKPGELALKVYLGVQLARGIF
jgi:hypothetical protein